MLLPIVVKQLLRAVQLKQACKNGNARCLRIEIRSAQNLAECSLHSVRNCQMQLPALPERRSTVMEHERVEGTRLSWENSELAKCFENNGQHRNGHRVQYGLPI